MVLTKTKLAAGIGIVLLIAGAFVVKKIYFPTVDESWFQLDYRRLQHAPGRIFILRPTHFIESRRSGCFSASASYDQGKYLPRFLGRNVGLDQIIALAYQCQPSRVVLPHDVTTNHFDFLITVRDKPAERFQTAVKKKLGYTAEWKQRETEVLQLKVSTSGTPGLHASTNNNGGINFKDNRLYFTHMPAAQLARMLENVLKKPVEDKTGLWGFYDFSIAWNWRGRNEVDEAALRNSISELGLSLESDTGTQRMLVVEKVK